MPVSIGARPESGFDEPLGLLGDCHRRIERFLGMLITVAEQARGAALNEEQRRALEAALRYFREAAPRHTQDEEESLFPRMRACSDVRVRAALDKLVGLEADHARAQAGHEEADRLGREWLETGALRPEAADRLRTVLSELRALYEAHIRLEDAELFPLAGATLTAGQLAAVGQEMARRRGITR